MCLDVFLDRILLLDVFPHASFAQGQVRATKPMVHPVNKLLPRVLARAILPEFVPGKSKALKDVTYFSGQFSGKTNYIFILLIDVSIHIWKLLSSYPV